MPKFVFLWMRNFAAPWAKNRMKVIDRKAVELCLKRFWPSDCGKVS